MKKLVLWSLIVMSSGILSSGLDSRNFNTEFNKTKIVIKNKNDSKLYLNKIFTDKNLIDALKIKLNYILKKDQQGYFIFQSDIEKVTSLVLLDQNLKDIKGLDIFVNLDYLEISDNPLIKDFSPLSKLQKLTALEIGVNTISDLSSFANLTNLKEINFHDNIGYIKDFSPLSNIKSLKSLNLQGSQLFNSSSLSKLQNLTTLYLGLTNISDLSFLKTMTNLERLYLNNNRNLLCFPSLSSLVNLNYLNLTSSYIKNPQSLEEIKNLKVLILEFVDLSDYSFISAIKSLNELDLSHNIVNDINFLSPLNILQSLDLSFNIIKNINPLGYLLNLRNLNLLVNAIPNNDEAWAPLHNLPYYDPSWDDFEVRSSQQSD